MHIRHLLIFNFNLKPIFTLQPRAISKDLRKICRFYHYFFIFLRAVVVTVITVRSSDGSIIFSMHRR